MKRMLALLVLLCLLLPGCGGGSSGAEPEAAPEADAESTAAAQTAGEAPAEKPPLPAPEEPTPPAQPQPAPDPRRDTVSAILAEMTPEEKVGQMFFVQCPALGQSSLVSQYHLGGYLLFGRDLKDSGGQWLTAQALTEKIASWQAAGDIPLLIGVDEEGGTVARVTRNPNLSPARRRSPQQVFAAGGMEAIRQDTAAISGLLLGLGINVNFAPVADVSTDPGDFIYDRAFGQGAEATGEYIRTAVAAMNESGIGSVLKHFPGYGSNADTHTGMAVDMRPYEAFSAGDFLPFRAGIGAGADAVLVSHNIVVCMDDSLPASLSPEVHRVLRQELAFDGVILTDDLAMGAVERYAADHSAAVLAVLAGNDMIVTADFENQIPMVIRAVEEGRIPMETIDAAVARILGWKYDLGLLSGLNTGD